MEIISDAGPSNSTTPSARTEAPSHPLPHTPFYAIEYPGFVNASEASIQAAMHTLGGQPAVDKIFKQAKSKIMEMRLRPEDVFAHPVPGEVVPTSKLLVKVVKRRRKQRDNGEGSNAREMMDVDPVEPSGSFTFGPTTNDYRVPEGEFTAEVIGTISKTVRFRAMADFQYSPDPSDPMVQIRKSMENLDDETIKLIHGFQFASELEDYALPLPPEEVEKSASDPSLPKSKSNLRLPPPPLFMRTSLFSQYNYKPNPFSVVQTVTNEETGEEKQRLINKTRFKGFGAIAIDFDDKGPVPTKPTEAMEGQRVNANAELLKRVIELLEERPVWSRVALMNQFSLSQRKDVFNSKIVLPLAAYVFNDGPFRDAYVRFGYDPRKDVEARFYQRITFRNSSHHFRRRPLIVPSDNPEPSQPHTAGFETSHVFDGKTAKYEVSPGFQLCDIHDPLLKGLIEDDNAVRDNGECHERDGFYSAAALDRIKAILKRKLTGLMEEGRVVSDSECADIMARVPTLTKVGPITEIRLITPHVVKARDRKRNKAKHVLTQEEVAAVRLKATLEKQELGEAQEYEDEGKDDDSDYVP